MSLYQTSVAFPVMISAAPTSGVAQVESTPIVGTITQAGTATFTITAANLTGSPLAVDVDVALNDTPTLVAAKAAAKLNTVAAISAVFVASSVTDTLKLTAVQSLANDATLNIAYTNGTCTGLTPDASSDNTTSGVLADFRGIEKGAFLVDTTNKKCYQNTGTPNVPTWTLL